jgi:hypothetical protein
LQKLSFGEFSFEHVTYNLTVFAGKSIAAFGWLHSANIGTSLDFVKSFSQIAVQDKADAAIRLAFEHLENTYIKPSWWHSLPENTRRDAIKRIKTGIGPSGPERQANCLSHAPERYISASVVQEISSLGYTFTF